MNATVKKVWDEVRPDTVLNAVDTLYSYVKPALQGLGIVDKDGPTKATAEANPIDVDSEMDSLSCIGMGADVDDNVLVEILNEEGECVGEKYRPVTVFEFPEDVNGLEEEVEYMSDSLQERGFPSLDQFTFPEDRVEAIKVIRVASGWGLEEARNWVDSAIEDGYLGDD